MPRAVWVSWVSFLSLALSCLHMTCGHSEPDGTLVRVRVQGNVAAGDRGELKLELGKQRYQPILVRDVGESFLIVLPAESTGKLTLSATVTDRGGCVSRGQTEVLLSARQEGIAEAKIELDPLKFPACPLQIDIQGAGQVRVKYPGREDICKPDRMKTSCEYHIKKGSRVTLLAEETAADSDFESWQVGEGTPELKKESRAMLFPQQSTRLDALVSLTAQFQTRVCRVDGLCMPGGNLPATLWSPNGLWRIQEAGTVSAWVNNRWQAAEVKQPDAVAIWGTGDRAWVVRRSGQIVLYRVSGMGVSSPAELTIGGTPGRSPATLFGYSGATISGASMFYAVTRQAVYGCTEAACTAEPITDKSLALPSEPSALVAMYRHESGELVAAGIGSDAASENCVYLSRGCGSAGCEKLDFPAACQAGKNIPLVRAEGASAPFWALLVDRLYRIKGSAWLSTRAKGLRPLRAAEDLAGNTWLLDTASRIFRATTANGLDPGQSYPPANQTNTVTLSALFVDPSGSAWVAGSNGTLLSCRVSGGGVRCTPMGPTSQSQWEVVHGDRNGNVWAAGSGRQRVYCPKAMPCMMQGS